MTTFTRAALAELADTLGAAPSPTGLKAMTDAFAGLGRAALADRRGRGGPQWGVWADWCWRNELPALPAAAGTASRFAEELAAEMHDVDTILAICAVVTSRHLAAGYDDPWRTQ